MPLSGVQLPSFHDSINEELIPQEIPPFPYPEGHHPFPPDFIFSPILRAMSVLTGLPLEVHVGNVTASLSAAFGPFFQVESDGQWVTIGLGQLYVAKPGGWKTRMRNIADKSHIAADLKILAEHEAQRLKVIVLKKKDELMKHEATTEQPIQYSISDPTTESLEVILVHSGSAYLSTSEFNKVLGNFSSDSPARQSAYWTSRIDRAEGENQATVKNGTRLADGSSLVINAAVQPPGAQQFIIKDKGAESGLAGRMILIVLPESVERIGSPTPEQREEAEAVLQEFWDITAWLRKMRDSGTELEMYKHIRPGLSTIRENSSPMQGRQRLQIARRMETMVVKYAEQEFPGQETTLTAASRYIENVYKMAALFETYRWAQSIGEEGRAKILHEYNKNIKEMTKQTKEDMQQLEEDPREFEMQVGKGGKKHLPPILPDGLALTDESLDSASQLMLWSVDQWGFYERENGGGTTSLEDKLADFIIRFDAGEIKNHRVQAGYNADPRYIAPGYIHAVNTKIDIKSHEFKEILNDWKARGLLIQGDGPSQLKYDITKIKEYVGQ